MKMTWFREYIPAGVCRWASEALCFSDIGCFSVGLIAPSILALGGFPSLVSRMPPSSLATCRNVLHYWLYWLWNLYVNMTACQELKVLFLCSLHVSNKSVPYQGGGHAWLLQSLLPRAIRSQSHCCCLAAGVRETYGSCLATKGCGSS